jgi:transcription antitermination factor NusG
MDGGAMMTVTMIVREKAMTAAEIDGCRAADRWMVGWTNPYAEFDVVAELRALGFAAFAPAIRKTRVAERWARNRGCGKERSEVVIAPAFPRYVLFSASAAQPVWQRALRVRGITLVVRRPGGAGEPGVLPATLVRSTLLGAEGNGIIVDLAKTIAAMARFAEGAGVRITSGPFEHFPGVVVGHEGRNVRVLLSGFGRQSEAVMSPESLAVS